MNAPLSVPAFEPLAVLFDTLSILSPTRLRLGEQELDIDSVPAMTTPNATASGQVDAAAQLADTLSTLIYFFCYTRPYRGEAMDPAELQRPVVADQPFIDGLTAANPTLDRWDAGWKVFQAEASGAVHLLKNDAATVAQPGQYAYLAGAGRPATAGAMVDLSIARQSLQHQPGMYYAFGDAVPSDYDMARLSRLYFNVPSAEAGWLLARVGTLLNRYRVPYRFKCPVDPQRFDRSDSAVLYVARRFVATVLRLLRPLASELAARLRVDTPLFTRPVLPGVGAADEPGDGQSFGQSRARLIAQALLDSGQAGGADARRAALAARFRKQGLDPARPYLAAGLADVYAVPQEIHA